MQVILLAPATSPAIFGHHSVILLLGFATSALLHRCTQITLVQPFFILILKGNAIVVCSCPMSHAIWQVVFSKPVDNIIASLLFGSLFYHLSHVLLEPGMQMNVANKV